MLWKKEIVGNFGDWLAGKPFSPIVIELKPTNLCNLSCISCRAMGSPKYRPDTEIKHEHYLKFIDSLSSTGVKRIHITGGGEPLAYPGIGEVVGCIMKNRIHGSITTNATLFTPGLLESMVRGGWNHIFVSLDGPDEKTHDHLRGRIGAFSSVMENIGTLNSLKKKYGSRTPTIELGMVLSEANIGKIDAYFELGHRLGAKNITLQPLRVQLQEHGKELVLSEKSKRNFISSMVQLKKKAERYDIIHNLDHFDSLFINEISNIKGVIMEYSGKKESDASIPCYHPWYFFSVQPDGKVYPCSFKLEEEFGSISGGEPVGEIWNNAKFNSFRERFYRRELPDFCNMCCGTNIMITKELQEEIEALQHGAGRK
jgi:radical SAM protein with 4Fe4S-binding SPASM domain